MKQHQTLITLKAQQDDDRKRFDKVVRKLLPRMSLSMVYTMIRKGGLLLNTHKVKPSATVTCGDSIGVAVILKPYMAGNPLKIPVESAAAGAKAANLINKLKIFENNDVLVINKPRGYLVHGTDSLTPTVQRYWQAQRRRALSFKPGPVHRLDRNTSGLQMFCLSLVGARTLTGLFKTGRIKKIYIALVEGIISKAEVWVDWLARDSNTRRSLAAKQDRGREAVTEIIPVAAGNRTSCILCLPRTGRTHQIRAQAALHGHPLEGDKKYGSSGKAPFYVLHAAGVCIQEEYNSLRIPALSAELPGPAEDVFCRLFSRDILARVYTAVRTQLKKGVPGVHLTHK